MILGARTVSQLSDNLSAADVSLDTVRHNRTPDFESGAIDHSTTSPGAAFSQGRIIAFRTARYAITSGLMTTSKIYSRAVRPHKQGM